MVSTAAITRISSSLRSGHRPALRLFRSSARLGGLCPGDPLQRRAIIPSVAACLRNSVPHARALSGGFLDTSDHGLDLTEVSVIVFGGCDIETGQRAQHRGMAVIGRRPDRLANCTCEGAL
jgi:hypothetical protein